MSVVDKDPHPHRELIKIWIEDRNTVFQYQQGDRWIDVKDPMFHPSTKYRVKPAALVAMYRVVYQLNNGMVSVTTEYYRDMDHFYDMNPSSYFPWAKILPETMKMV